MKQKTLFIIAAVILLTVFLVATLVYKSEKIDQSAQLAERNRAHLVRMHAPTLGPAQAKVQIVEFLDPACETCRAFYPLVKEMMAANPGQIHLVLRYAPFHKGSDAVVAILEAARKQGKFWPALEALLATQADWAPHHTPQLALVWQKLEGLDLNLEQLRLDMMAPEIAQLIAQDLADAQALNVTQTPEFFVNGAPLPTFGYEPLKALVDAALTTP
ncbi:DsbA family protein [Denitratisoma oestradiolicum]|uniref:Disulfide bond formation protein DsbA n=1 Tax=Denitratisoma oestradiolicum TaxID=311182 RepID=A0A6S6XTQ9_9PROT|nr:thioredoxin domain-containing protein [Denitratisoma oestradiolicum]TWO80916.1 disulfide bond formation protein DsbA [Denitratisoma oestradiolicum]CAB1367317.1 Disulfide bond formation protein DsbA [Denitratisoma oestradiolicum]